jgi:hypothetical protein
MIRYFLLKINIGKLLAVLLLAGVFPGCGDSDPIFPIEPEVTFVDITPKTVREGVDFDDPVTPLELTVAYKDGDGDLGGQASADFFVRDLRPELPLIETYIIDTSEDGIDNPVPVDSVVYSGLLEYRLPEGLTPEARKPSIQGEITLEIAAGIRRLGKAPNTTEADTAQFEVWMMDRAGNESNRVRTDSIIILPPA